MSHSMRLAAPCYVAHWLSTHLCFLRPWNIWYKMWYAVHVQNIWAADRERLWWHPQFQVSEVIKSRLFHLFLWYQRSSRSWSHGVVIAAKSLQVRGICSPHFAVMEHSWTDVDQVNLAAHLRQEVPGGGDRQEFPELSTGHTTSGSKGITTATTGAQHVSNIAESGLHIKQGAVAIHFTRITDLSSMSRALSWYLGQMYFGSATSRPVDQWTHSLHCEYSIKLLSGSCHYTPGFVVWQSCPLGLNHLTFLLQGAVGFETFTLLLHSVFHLFIPLLSFRSPLVVLGETTDFGGNIQQRTLQLRASSFNTICRISSCTSSGCNCSWISHCIYL